MTKETQYDCDECKNEKQIMQLIEAVTNMNENIQLLNNKIEQLDKWRVQHEIEGIEYGEDFEKRDLNIINRIEKIEEILAL